MTQPSRTRVAGLTTGLALGLLLMGALRFASTHPGPLTSLSGYATPGYIFVTVVFAIWLTRAGLPLNRLGFGIRLNWRHVGLAALAVAILRLSSFAFEPLLEALFGGPRNLERFSDVEGSATALAALLLASWTFAAFGEELAYRIVLLRGIVYALGDTRAAVIVALVLQAVLFGLIHSYQGATGIASSAVSGLVFGAVTVAARWSIWPAALAHGANNTFGIVALYYG